MNENYNMYSDSYRWTVDHVQEEILNWLIHHAKDKGQKGFRREDLVCTKLKLIKYNF